MRRHRPGHPVAPEGPRRPDRHDLEVLAELVVHLQIALTQDPLHLVGVQRRLRNQGVHPGNELAHGWRHDEILAVIEERLHRRRHAPTRPPDDVAHRPIGQVEVLLGARQDELLLDDPLVEHEPGVIEPRLPQILQRAERVETGVERRGQSVAGPVQPHGRRPRNDPYAVLRPHRVPVADPLDVVPHPVAVDDPPTGAGRDAHHPPVDMGGDPDDRLAGWQSKTRWPGRPHEVEVAADAAAGHDDRPGRQLELARRLSRGRDASGHVGRREPGPADAADDTSGEDEVVDPVPERIAQPPGHLGLLGEAHERLADPRPGAPRHVETRHRVAVPARGAVAALGPPDEGEELDVQPGQPGAHLARGELDIGPGPLLAPVVLAAGPQPVPAGRALPVRPRQLVRVLDPHPALLGGVDEEQPAQGPERLPAEVLPRLLVDDDHPLAGSDGFSGGDQAGEAGSDDDDVGVGHGPIVRTRARRLR